MAPFGPETVMTVSSDDVDAQLEHIFASPEFRSSNRLKRFLRFVVDQTVAGKSEQIKGYTIGIEVFDRPTDFDPQTDTIVRVEASRLRRALSRYYLGAGRDDPIKIEIPKGTYVPVMSGKAEPDAPTLTSRAFEPPPVAPDKPSIAVLPFLNMSGDPEQEYFADGIAEDVITALSRFRSLFVIARTSSFTYKGRAVDINLVARELGVRYVVEGSVRKAGNRVRITAQLIDATSGNHLWAERFDGRLDDVFDLQDQITEQIVVSIEPEIQVRERERARRKPPENLDAWGLVQRGLSHFYRMNKTDHAEAIRLFREAIALDPEFALARAYLAYALWTITVTLGDAENPANDAASGRADAEKAVSLDPNEPMAHFALGRILVFAGEPEMAIGEMQTAIALNPNFAHGHYGLAMAYTCGAAQAEQALPHLDAALRLSPRDPLRWLTLNLKGSALRFLGRYDEAIAICRQACQVPDTGFLPHLYLAAALADAGQESEARATVEKAMQLQPMVSIRFLRERYLGRHETYLKSLFDSLRQAGLPE